MKIRSIGAFIMLVVAMALSPLTHAQDENEDDEMVCGMLGTAVGISVYSVAGSQSDLNLGETIILGLGAYLSGTVTSELCTAALAEETVANEFQENMLYLGIPISWRDDEGSMPWCLHVDPGACDPGYDPDERDLSFANQQFVNRAWDMVTRGADSLQFGSSVFSTPYSLAGAFENAYVTYGNDSVGGLGNVYDNIGGD